jgi:G:T-mismatch repair DNA endonuclease (very short patch repair protein)
MALFVGCNAGFQETYFWKNYKTIREEPQSRREWMLEYFSKACEHVKKKNIKVWQNGYHAEHIYSNKFIRQKLDYIHNNPVKIELLLCQKIIITVLPETMLV